MASINALIAKIEKDLKTLKLSVKTTKKVPKEKVSKKEPKGVIEKCKKKADLQKFTVAELKDWVKKNSISTKKIEKSHKEDWVNIVWKNMKKSNKNSESEQDSSEESETDYSSDESDDEISDLD